MMEVIMGTYQKCHENREKRLLAAQEQDRVNAQSKCPCCQELFFHREGVCTTQRTHRHIPHLLYCSVSCRDTDVQKKLKKLRVSTCSI